MVNKKIYINSFWMMSEKIVSLLGLIFVTSFVARYIGTTLYGDLALALSIFQLVQIISQLGSDVIVFKRVSKKKDSGKKLLASTWPIRLGIYLSFSLPVLFYYLLNGKDVFIYIVATFVSCMFQSLDVYSIFYDAILKSKINTLVNMIGLTISLVARWFIAYFHLNPIYLCIPIVLATLIPFLLRLFSYVKNETIVNISFRDKIKYSKYLIYTGSAFVLSSISIAIYTRMSMFMLGYTDGGRSVGIYSVAAMLASCWSFVLYSFITSFLPGIFSEKDAATSEYKTATLNRLVILISLFFILSSIVLSKYFIFYFYGPDFSTVYIPLNILSFSTCVSALGAVSARYIAKYAGYKYLSMKMFLVFVFSIPLSLFLIRSFGVLGAAISTLAIELLSLTVMNYFFNRGIVFSLHKRTLNIKLIKSKERASCRRR